MGNGRRGFAQPPWRYSLAPLRRMPRSACSYWPTSAPSSMIAPMTRFTSEDMIAKLRDIESSPWADWDHGEGLGKNKLARFLRKYDVAPRTVRLEAQVAKGYLREPFADAWSRYVTPGLYAGSRKSWRRGAESNRRIKVLQTSPLPLGYRALPFHLSSLPYQHQAQGSVLSGSWSNSAPRRLPPR